MEMTPLTLRDTPVSSGDGAKPHGRDLSSTETTSKEAQAQQPQLTEKTEQVIEKQQLPIDSTAEALAARLRMADPNLDAKQATKIAKELLTSNTTKWETKDSSADSHGSVNLSA